MKIVLNKIKEWKKYKKWYYKDFWNNLLKSNSKYKENFLKLSKTKSLEKREDILKIEFKLEDIREKSKASYLFIHLWIIIGIIKDGREICVNWNKIKRPSIRELKKIMKKNNYKEIELKAIGFIDGSYIPILKIIK